MSRAAGVEGAVRRNNGAVRLFATGLRLLPAGLVALLLAAFLGVAAAATSTSRATGNWNTGSTWSTTRTGTIVTNAGSANVTGTGTLFTTELAVNDVIMTGAGA